MSALPPMTQAEAVRSLAVQVERIGSKSLAARAWGVTPQFLSMVLSGERNLGPKLSKAVGLKAQRFVIYRYAPQERPHA